MLANAKAEAARIVADAKNGCPKCKKSKKRAPKTPEQLKEEQEKYLDVLPTGAGASEELDSQLKEMVRIEHNVNACTVQKHTTGCDIVVAVCIGHRG